MTTTVLFPMLAWSVPSTNLVLIAIVGAILPTTFFLWLNWWLSSVKDENPDQVIAAQEKADKAHREQHGGHGHGHGHGHGDGHHHAHA